MRQPIAGRPPTGSAPACRSLVSSLRSTVSLRQGLRDPERADDDQDDHYNRPSIGLTRQVHSAPTPTDRHLMRHEKPEPHAPIRRLRRKERFEHALPVPQRHPRSVVAHPDNHHPPLDPCLDPHLRGPLRRLSCLHRFPDYVTERPLQRSHSPPDLHPPLRHDHPHPGPRLASQGTDLLVVDRTRQPTDGNIVVSALNGELTVTKIPHRNGLVFLLPENPDYTPVEVDEVSDLTVGAS